MAPPYQMILVALAFVSFLISAYLRPDVPGKLTNFGLAMLTLALIFRS